MSFFEKADYIIGIRASGLILYGALPANLALLGMLEVKLGKVENLLSLSASLLFLPASLLPLAVTFLLVRNRCREWYLTKDFLLCRSLVVTFLLTCCVSLITGAAGVINGKYILTPEHIFDRQHFTVMAESFLLGISSLVITSTLFMSILTKAPDLPALPSSKFVELLNSIRNKIKQMQRSEIWHYEKFSDCASKASELADKTIEDIDALTAYIRMDESNLFLVKVRNSTTLFQETLALVGGTGNEGLQYIKWRVYFSDKDDLSPEAKRERESGQGKEKYEAVRFIKGLNV
jgi:hypothetical protein